MNIATLLRRAAADHAGQVALRLDDTELRYAHYADQAARFAGYLRAEGVAPGQRVGVYLPTRLEYLTSLLGTWQAGAVGVPLNYMFPEAPLRHAIVDSGATHLVLLPADADRIKALLGDACPVLLTIGEGGSFAAACAGHEPFEAVVPRLDGDDALIMYTSGSTGVPKGVRQTHRNVVAQCDAVIDLYEVTSDDHSLNCAPLFHVAGLQFATLTMLLRGVQITFMPKWDALRWLELVQTLRPTFAGLVSTMMIDVGNRTVEQPVLVDSLRMCVFGGSRAPTAAIDRFAKGTGLRPIEIYGQTEQNGLVATYAPHDQRRPDSMGRPLEQVVQTRLVPTDGGADLQPGDEGVGELWVRGDAVTPGYWHLDLPEKWSDGWYRTGDLMSRDAEGYLYYVERIDDMIVSGGENIFPQVVEEHLANCPDLAEVAIIGTAHERWVQQVTAIVVPNREGVTAEDVAAYCETNPNLRGMHRPRRIEIVDALPRTGSGKLNRPELRKQYS